ncbi:MAG: capsule assembly Wzi family protein, partial [Kangiellaceae bacterium]|nr:capsule assembly Wzi family protein [Kangiellaceae bacterium]
MSAKPWIGTDELQLRADVETLSDIGVVRIPITTYPLMWSGIAKDLDNITVDQIPEKYKNSYWRVKKAVKNALNGKAESTLKISAANSAQVFRSFGDSSREEFEVSASRSGVSKKFAWNLEVTHVSNPVDGDSARLDDSYAAIVLGNWVGMIGYTEKWWGPAWQSNSLLSNNARPPLGISIQRNYSDAESNPMLSWLGPWTIKGFIAGLDDERKVKNAKLAGVSFSVKPLKSLEFGVRVTNMFGGEGRSESLPNLIEGLLGENECDLPHDFSCDDFYNSDQYSLNGDRIAGLDFRWAIPTQLPISVYYSAYGEGESDFLPSKTMKQLGISGSANIFGENWRWFIEAGDTSLNRTEFDLAYESPIYQTGYRYLNRSIGSTFDSDSEVIAFGLIGKLDRTSSFSFTYFDASLNTDGEGGSSEDMHSLASRMQDVTLYKMSWSFLTKKYGEVKLTFSSIEGV